MVQTLRKQFLAPVCIRMKLGQVQTWVHDPLTHTSIFGLANITLRQLPGGPDGPDPQEAILGPCVLQDEVRSGPSMGKSGQIRENWLKKEN